MSVLKGKWVNRGFMRGPFLPIYGSGAIIVLIFTLPYRDNAVAVFFMGMISATILEYFTGVAMEKLFHVRYWDYSKNKFNVNGHICLSSSLAWGVFSVILTLYAHNPIEHWVLCINSNLLEFLVFILTVYISIDMAESVREALNLKEMLMSLEENNAEFRRIQKHVEVVAAFYGTEIKEKSEAGLKKISGAIELGKEKYAKLEEGKKKKKSARVAFVENIEKSRIKKENLLKAWSEILEAYDEKRKSQKSAEDATVTEEIKEAMAGILKQSRNIFNMKNKEYMRLRDLLKRNPEAVSKMHEQAFLEIMDMTKDKQDINEQENSDFAQ